ncbi:hypothetical protein O7598_31090 [Micromonospora sp. WMMC241]|uniref:hypothetical protein n=1 Tax=Micromonospora sp. WMMC241 TaxID=3015159 RepID=UPI0022B7043D|nr:hypothetical protein [Micromonospora sp. WMMC241]MCZ7440802.1 hypothetical protein [Micromonospora sp. WMMC241]MCZ7440871.1 hypothetical protein [Micromonospora sp. WMMC241]
MAGFSQLREAGWLYGADPTLPLALVRLFEHVDGSGRWEVRLNSPASEPSQVAVFDGEGPARAEVARIYADGAQDGTWRVRQPDAY